MTGIHHALLIVASLSLAGFGHRIGARLTPVVLERIVCAAVLGTAAAVAQCLILGLLDLGSSSALLTVLALGSYGVVRLRVAAPAPTTGELTSSWFRSLSPMLRASAGAMAGVAVLLVLWPLRYPLIGFDGAVYHLPEVVGWVQSGRPGQIEPVSYLFPFANYPITNEIALTWSMSIARSMVPFALWTQILFVLTALAGIAGLRTLRVRAGAASLAVAAALTTPVLLRELNTPSTDIAALAWLACAAALAAGAGKRPGLLAPAVVAAGLACGTKTTALPLAVCIVGLGAWRARAALRSHARPLIVAVAAAVGVGGIWYVRNAVAHGSPLWPFASLPGGTAVPHVWNLIDSSLLSRPSATLSPRVAGYLSAFGGALILFAGAAFAWLIRRSRSTAIASAVAVAALLLWVSAPSTGQPDTPVFDVNVLSTTRYAIPAIAAAALALALADGRTGRRPRAASALLGAALVWNVLRAANLGHMFVPYAGWLLIAAGAGAALTVVRVRVRGALRPRLVATLVAVGAGAPALAWSADGFVARHGREASGIPGASLALWAGSDPGFRRARRVAFAGTMFGQMAGDGLENRLQLLAPGQTCARTRTATRRDVVVVADTLTFRKLGVLTPSTQCLPATAIVFREANARVYDDR